MEEAGVALREPKVCRDDLAYAVHAEPHLHRLIFAAKVRGPKRCGCKVRRRLRAESAAPSLKRLQDQGISGVIAFKTIRARAEKRKGGPEALAALMPPKPDPKALRELRDDRGLAEMTKRVFSAGFAWSVIENKWPGFEEAFIGFEPSRLTFEPDEFWHKLTMNARIVRNGAKIMSVRENARFVLEVAKEHGSFAKFLADWPPANEVGLLELLSKRGSRLGGATGQMLLRFLGYDAFVATKDVAA